MLLWDILVCVFVDSNRNSGRGGRTTGQGFRIDLYSHLRKHEQHFLKRILCSTHCIWKWDRSWRRTSWMSRIPKDHRYCVLILVSHVGHTLFKAWYGPFLFIMKLRQVNWSSTWQIDVQIVWTGLLLTTQLCITNSKENQVDYISVCGKTLSYNGELFREPFL